MMKDGIPYRNHSPHGWWIASYVQRAAFDDPNPAPNNRCLAWENTIILQASDREAAYEKAMRMGKMCEEGSPYLNSDGEKVYWIFDGLISLLPIFDELEDGAEILWREYKNKTVGKVRSWVKQKHELEAFDDTPCRGDFPDDEGYEKYMKQRRTGRKKLK